jgi:hypothetical protein
MTQIILLIFGGLLSAFLSWVFKADFTKVTVFFEIFKVVLFITVFIIHCLGFFNVFFNKQIKAQKSKLGLFILFFGTLINFFYIISSIGWFFYSPPLIFVDRFMTHFHHVLELFICFYFVLCCQYVSIMDVGKSAIPGIEVDDIKLIGHILVDLGVNEKLIEKALKVQKEQNQKNSKIGGSNA